MNAPAGPAVALFVATDYIGLLVANRAVKILCESGIKPVLFDIQTRLNRRVRTIAPPAMNHYVINAFDEVVIPYLERHPAPGAACLTYRQLADAYGLAYHAIGDVNDAHTAGLLGNIDRLVGGQSFRFPQVFNARTIQFFKSHGRFLWNMHGGLLPDYKGFLIPYRAIANEEAEYGWTLHEIDEGIDTGCIIGTARLPLNPKQPVLDTYLNLVAPSASMMTHALIRQVNGQAMACVSHFMPRADSYYGYPTEQEMHEFEKNGVRFIESPGRFIHDVVHYFSVPGTSHADGLRDGLIHSIAEYERTSPRAVPAQEQEVRQSA